MPAPLPQHGEGDDGGDHHQNRHRGGIGHLARLDEALRERVHVERFGRHARSAAGHHIDQVEGAQRLDHLDEHQADQRRLQHRQGDISMDLPVPGVVEARRLDRLRRQGLQQLQHDNGEEQAPLPDIDGGDGEQCRRRLGQRVEDQPAGQQPVRVGGDAVERMVGELPDEGGRDTRQQDRDNEQQAVDVAQARRGDLEHQHAQSDRYGHGGDNRDDLPLHRNPNRIEKAAVEEQIIEVRQPDIGIGRRGELAVLQGNDDRVERRHHRQDQENDERRHDEGDRQG